MIKLKKIDILKMRESDLNREIKLSDKIMKNAVSCKKSIKIKSMKGGYK
jgi:hypothetical protein